MIVVDSSVWIANLRGLDTLAVRKLRAAVDDESDLLIGDLILLEVLQGARDEPHAALSSSPCSLHFSIPPPSSFQLVW